MLFTKNDFQFLSGSQIKKEIIDKNCIVLKIETVENQLYSFTISSSLVLLKGDQLQRKWEEGISNFSISEVIGVKIVDYSISWKMDIKIDFENGYSLLIINDINYWESYSIWPPNYRTIDIGKEDVSDSSSDFSKYF